MIKNNAKYMKAYKEVFNTNTGLAYKLIENMSADKNTVKAVSLANLWRYEILTAKINNWEKNQYDFRERFSENIDNVRAEKTSYEEELNISELTPHNKIRFITPNYTTKFEVTDLSQVLVNGKAVTVVYLDDYHFEFIEDGLTVFFGGCFHICEFAELCERCHIEVKPLV